jgi:nitroreductase
MREIEDRRSVRRYRDEKVDRKLVDQVLDAARLAPSGSNTQPWAFIVVESPETKERIVAVDHGQRWMMAAPVFIVCVADIRCRLDEDCTVVLDENSPEPELKQIIRDTAIAIEHILLEAEHQGLSTCWTGWFEQDGIRPILGIPADKYVCGVVTLGYGDESPKPRSRKELEDIVHHEKW